MADLAKGPKGQGDKRKRNSNSKTTKAERTSEQRHKAAAAGQERKSSSAVRNASKDLLLMFGKSESEGTLKPDSPSETPGKAAGKGKKGKKSGSAGKKSATPAYKGTPGAGANKSLDRKQGSQAVRDAARQLLADLGGGTGAPAAATEPSSSSKDEAATKQSNAKQAAPKPERQEKGRANTEKKVRGESGGRDGAVGAAGDGDGDGRITSESNEKRRKKRKKAMQKSSGGGDDDAEGRQQQQQHEESGEGGVRALAAAAAAAGGASSRKGAKRLKVQQHLLVKGETLTPASLSNRKFDTDSTDHCETPFEAYRDIEPFLFSIAKGLKKSKGELRIYDPYYCEGSMLKHLSKLGFTSVYNRNEDFYAAIARGKIPEHDVVVTNPPFSGDHMSKIVAFCAQNPTGPKPFFLLMPNFVMKKTYYKDSVGDGPSDVPPPMLLAPKKAYKFWSPGRSKFCSRFVANTRGGVGAATPFETIWYLGGLKKKSVRDTREWWRRKYEDAAMCTLAEDESGLPENMVPVKVVGGERRMNPRRRKAMIAAKKQQRNRP